MSVLRAIRTIACSTIATTAACRPKSSPLTHVTDPDEQSPRGDPTAHTVHQPAEIGGELLSLRTGQEQAVVQGVDKPPITDPSAAVDDLAVHHSDLARRPT